jgi:hypothetical protein
MKRVVFELTRKIAAHDPAPIAVSTFARRCHQDSIVLTLSFQRKERSVSLPKRGFGFDLLRVESFLRGQNFKAPVAVYLMLIHADGRAALAGPLNRTHLQALPRQAISK